MALLRLLDLLGGGTEHSRRPDTSPRQRHCGRAEVTQIPADVRARRWGVPAAPRAARRCRTRRLSVPSEVLDSALVGFDAELRSALERATAHVRWFHGLTQAGRGPSRAALPTAAPGRGLRPRRAVRLPLDRAHGRGTRSRRLRRGDSPLHPADSRGRRLAAPHLPGRRSSPRGGTASSASEERRPSPPYRTAPTPCPRAARSSIPATSGPSPSSSCSPRGAASTLTPAHGTFYRHRSHRGPHDRRRRPRGLGRARRPRDLPAGQR